MKTWSLIIFIFNVQHAHSAKYDFFSESACRQALAVIASSYEGYKATPAAATLRAEFIEDSGY